MNGARLSASKCDSASLTGHEGCARALLRLAAVVLGRACVRGDAMMLARARKLQAALPVGLSQGAWRCLASLPSCLGRRLPGKSNQYITHTDLSPSDDCCKSTGWDEIVQPRINQQSSQCPARLRVCPSSLPLPPSSVIVVSVGQCWRFYSYFSFQAVVQAFRIVVVL